MSLKEVLKFLIAVCEVGGRLPGWRLEMQPFDQVFGSASSDTLIQDSFNFEFGGRVERFKVVL